MTHIRAGWSRTQPDSECIGRMAFTSPPPLRKAPPWDGRLDLKKMHWKTYAYASPIHMRAHPIHVRTTWSLQQTTGTRTPQNWKAFVPSGYARMHHPDGFRRGRSFLPLVVSGFADRSIIVTLILNCLWRWFDSKLYVSDRKGVGQKERKAWLCDELWLLYRPWDRGTLGLTVKCRFPVVARFCAGGCAFACNQFFILILADLIMAKNDRKGTIVSKKSS